MSELPSKDRSSRVLVALESSLECLSALESAADLAADMRAELVALFIEDLDLFHLADLPFAREVDRTSGMTRRLDSLQMARALRAQAHEVRRTLTRATEQRHIRSSFRVVRGHFVVEAFSAAAEKDVLFLRGKGRVRGTTQTRALRSGARASEQGSEKKRAERGPVCVSVRRVPCRSTCLIHGKRFECCQKNGARSTTAGLRSRPRTSGGAWNGPESEPVDPLHHRCVCFGVRCPARNGESGWKSPCSTPREYAAHGAEPTGVARSH